MDVELLLVPDCPHAEAARQVLAEAARRAGLSGFLNVTVSVVRSDEQARRRGFQGSPTVLIDGTDPFAVPGGAVGLACRMYRTADGRLRGVPDAQELANALIRAGACRESEADDR